MAWHLGSGSPATDDPDPQAEGTVDRAAGHAQEAIGGAKRKARDVVADITDEDEVQGRGVEPPRTAVASKGDADRPC